MSKLLLSTAALVFSCSVAVTQEPVSPSPLELRLAKAPQWENGSLCVSLERANRSPHPLFLPSMGLYIYTSVSELQDDSGKTEQRWVNVYGARDIISWGATPIAPGEVVHDDLCLGSRVAVANWEKRPGHETRREIPLRGQLKIDAYYFLTEEDWQMNKAQHEGTFPFRTPTADSNQIAPPQEPPVVTILTQIPCKPEDCAFACATTPPLVVHGETRLVPDISMFESDWTARGEVVTLELARRFSSCPESSGRKTDN